MITANARLHAMSRCLRLMPSLLCAAVLMSLSVTLAPGAAASEAQAPRAVIELFTSQGCSACPPADAKVVAMARDPDIIALTLHVDYWDYLGWEDTLAHAAFSERQRDYAELRGDRGVFTPQMVVNGLYACIGSDQRALDASLASATRQAQRLPVPVRIERQGNDLTIALLADHPDGAEIWLLAVEPDVTVAIERGENRGREARYANVVRDITHITAWDGARTVLQARLPDDTGRFVILVQRRDGDRPGRVVGAARGDGIPAAGL